MAGKGHTSNEPKKRKHINDGGDKSNSKKLKLSTKSLTKRPPFNSDTQKQKRDKFNPKSEATAKDEAPQSRREQRLQSKERTDARKKKRKPHYTLEKELALLWEKMRRRNISKEDRSKFVSEALGKMKGKIHEIATSHVSSRVLQTCIKCCSQSEKDAVFNELRPHFLTLACDKYSTFVVKKLVDSASKKQLSEFISLLHGNVASLLRNLAGSIVIEQAYFLANAAQKQTLLMELYSPELKLFKDLVSTKETKLEDIITKLGLQKVSVVKHMNSVLSPILEKGIVDHSIIHKALLEFFTVADQASAIDVIRQLSTPPNSENTPQNSEKKPTTGVTQPPLLVRMIHTREGSKIAILCLRHTSAKERKLIIKGLKSHVHKAALDQYGSLVLAYIFSIVDDTKLVTQVLIKQLLKNLKEIIFDKNGRRTILQLLHPNCSRYYSPVELTCFTLFLPSLLVKDESELEPESENKKSEKPGSCIDLIKGGKKDPLVRRRELLVNSGLAETLTDMCIESAGDLLRSNFGKDIVYEVATGGADNILRPLLDLKLDALHEAVASLVAKSKHEKGEEEEEEEEEEHLLENFHSSRTIRKLVLDSPAFASTLWKKALVGKCKMWAQGHSSKVVSAYLESTDSSVRDMAREHLLPLVDAGSLKLPNDKPSTKED